MTAVCVTAVGVTAVRNDLTLWTIVNIGSRGSACEMDGQIKCHRYGKRMWLGIG